jgi:hypothetical protein
MNRPLFSHCLAGRRCRSHEPALDPDARETYRAMIDLATLGGSGNMSENTYKDQVRLGTLGRYGVHDLTSAIDAIPLLSALRTPTLLPGGPGRIE